MAKEAKENLGAKVAGTLLQEPIRVQVGDKEYDVAPPTMGTLMMVSALVPDIPYIDKGGNMLSEVLAAAKDSGALTKVVAVLILGAKAVHEERERRRGERAARGVFWAFKRGEPKQGDIVDELADELALNCSPSQVLETATKILQGMEIDSFFALSVSLQEVSLIQQTREAAKAAQPKTTPAGR